LRRQNCQSIIHSISHPRMRPTIRASQICCICHDSHPFASGPFSHRSAAWFGRTVRCAGRYLMSFFLPYFDTCAKLAGVA
jgi:hypothetical protein